MVPGDPSKYAELDVETLAPAIPITLSWTQYISGRDPAMDTVLAAARRR